VWQTVGRTDRQAAFYTVRCITFSRTAKMSVDKLSVEGTVK